MDGPQNWSAYGGGKKREGEKRGGGKSAPLRIQTQAMTLPPSHYTKLFCLHNTVQTTFLFLKLITGNTWSDTEILDHFKHTPNVSSQTCIQNVQSILKHIKCKILAFPRHCSTGDTHTCRCQNEMAILGFCYENTQQLPSCYYCIVLHNGINLFKIQLLQYATCTIKKWPTKA